MKKGALRILIGLSICVASTTLGVFAGVKITSSLYEKGLSNNTTNDSYLAQLEKVLKDNWYSEIYYGADIDEDLLIHQFIGALSTSRDTMLDPYTYLTKYTPSVPKEETGKLGITVSKYFDYPVIIEVDSKGAAYNHLKQGDIVLSISKMVDGQYKKFEITNPAYNYSTLFDAGLDKANSTIKVEVARFDEEGKLYLVEESIKLNKSSDTAYSYVVDEDIEDTLMVKLTGFTSSKGKGTSDQLDNILKNNKDSNLIIDLRNNGGGDLYSVNDVCDLFLPKDKLITTLTYKDGSKTSHYTTSDAMYEFDNIIILQNGNTASASEILISTLLYYYPEKVTLVGCKSYGKGIAQKTVSIYNGAYKLQYTCAKWLRPDDSWIGMTKDSSSTIGFYPLEENIIIKDSLLTKMEYYNSAIYYKHSDDYFAFSVDKVSAVNGYFFDVYNTIYGTNYRTDRYFDNNCLKAINDYQTLKGIDVDVNGMNDETFIYFVKDFYDLSNSYSIAHLNKAEEIIKG